MVSVIVATANPGLLQFFCFSIHDVVCIFGNILFYEMQYASDTAFCNSVVLCLGRVVRLYINEFFLVVDFSVRRGVTGRFLR